MSKKELNLVLQLFVVAVMKRNADYMLTFCSFHCIFMLGIWVRFYFIWFSNEHNNATKCEQSKYHPQTSKFSAFAVSHSFPIGKWCYYPNFKTLIIILKKILKFSKTTTP